MQTVIVAAMKAYLHGSGSEVVNEVQGAVSRDNNLGQRRLGADLLQLLLTCSLIHLGDLEWHETVKYVLLITL